MASKKKNVYKPKRGKCEPPAAQVPIRCGQSPPLMSYVAHMPSASKLADVSFTTVLRGVNCE